MKAIYFCFPYLGYGGVPVQFSLVANELVENGIEVHYIDYKNGAITNLNLSKKVIREEYREDRLLSIPENAVLVMQAMTPWSIFGGLDLDRDTKLLFWGCHPMNLLPSISWLSYSESRLLTILVRFILNSYFTKSRTFLDMLLSHNAIAFIDDNTVIHPCRMLGINVPTQAQYIPVPINIQNEQYKIDCIEENISACWVGRICDFKLPILLKVISDLEAVAINCNYDVKLTIIGDGPLYDKLLNHIENLGSLKIELFGNIKHSDVIDFLSSGNINIFFGMGTSALEAASFGIPTVLLDFSYVKVPAGYKYKFLHDVNHYSVGGFVADAMCNDQARIGMVELLQRVRGDYSKLSISAFNYVKDNHDIKFVAGSFLKMTESSKLRWWDIVNSDVNKRGYIYKFVILLRNFVDNLRW